MENVTLYLERSPIIHRTGSWVGLTEGVDAVAQRRISTRYYVLRTLAGYVLSVRTSQGTGCY